MATNQDSVEVECPECGHGFEWFLRDPEDRNQPALTVAEAAEGLLRNYTTGTDLTAGEVDGLAEDITRLLTEKYHVSPGVI